MSTLTRSVRKNTKCPCPIFATRKDIYDEMFVNFENLTLKIKLI
jgi:hypothetical protein